MRFPIYIGFEGRRVPDWLERIESADGTVRMTFAGIVIVTNRDGAYRCRGLFGSTMIRIRGNGGNVIVSVRGQHPPGGNGGVVFDCRPIVPAWLGWCAFVAALGALLIH